MSEPVTLDSLPYVVRDGMVIGTMWRYLVRGGATVELFVPDPKGPAEGWAPGQREQYMRQLENESRPRIRSAIKQQFGTTSFRLVSMLPASRPVAEVIDHERRASWNTEARS